MGHASKVLKSINHNRYTVVAGVVASAIAVVSGCSGLLKAESPTTGERVTEPELDRQEREAAAELLREARLDDVRLQAEIGAIQADAERRVEDLLEQAGVGELAREQQAERLTEQFASARARLADRTDAFARAMFTVRDTVGVINPAAGSIVGAIAGVVLAGVGIDNRRKDRVIREKKDQLRVAVPSTQGV